MEKSVTEWQILFSMTSGLEDFYTEDEAEYNEKFQDLIDDGDLQYVEQCIRKDYVWNEELEDWDEDWVEVLYDAENYDDYKDTQRASSLTESKDPTYIVCSYYDEKLHGLEDELKTDDWSEVEDFAHRKLMQGNMLEIENTKTGKYRRINPDEYDETFDGEFIVRPEELEETKENNTIKVKWSEHRDYGDFRIDIIQGELEDGRQFLSGDVDSVQVYKKGYNAIKRLNDKAKTDDEDEIEKIEKEMADNEDNVSQQELDQINNQIYNIEELDEKYNVYTLTGEDGVYNSHKVDTVDTIEQAEDRVAELNAETGNNAYYEKADDWWEANAERLIKYAANETPEIIVDLVYGGDYDMYMQNTSKEIALDIYNQLGKEETEKLLNEFEIENLSDKETAERFDKDLDGLKDTLTDLKNTLKTESKDTNRQLQQNYKKSLERELDKVQKEIENAGPGDISGLEDRRDFLMNKIDQLDSDLSRKEESKTNWKSQVKDIFKDMYEVGKPVDPDDVDRFVTELIDEEHIGSEDIRNEMIDYCLELLDNFNDLDMVEESKDVTVDDVKDMFNNLPDNIKSYLENTDNVPTKEIEGTLWFDITQEEKEQLEQFVNYIDTISEDVWRKWDEKTKLDMSSYANNADRICRNCTLKLESKDIKIESKDNKIEVENYHLEDMGGHTMAVFGKLKDGRYFAGNEEVMTLYDEDIWPQYCEDDPDTTIWEQEHTLLSTSRYDTNKENLQIYYDIISQTSFFDEDDLVWFKEHLGLDNNDVADKKQESKLTEETEKDLVPTGLSDAKAKDILNSVIGQMSDGIWENTSQMNRYWQYADIVEQNGELFIKVDRNSYGSGFYGKSDEEVRKFFANKVKQIAKEFINDYHYDIPDLKWDRNCTVECSYLDYNSGATIQDGYRVYDKLLGRIDRIKTESKLVEKTNIELQEEVEINIDDAIYTYLTTKGYETDESAKEFIKDYVVVKTWYEDMTSASSSEIMEKYLVVEVRAELDYDDLSALSSDLDKVVQKYDASSYFDFITGGIIRAYIQVDDKKLTESIDTNKVVTDFQNMVKEQGIHVTRDVLNEYMTDLFENEMETEEDMDNLNEAESWLENYYGLNEIEEYDDETDWLAEEESDALDRFEQRYMSGGNGFTANKKTESKENKDNDFKNAVMELHSYIEANPKTISQDLRKAINNKSLDDYLKTKAAMTDDEIKSFKDKYKLIEDYVRTDLEDIGGWNPQKFKVSLNSARETLQELDDLMEITFNNLYYAPGLSEEFLDELQQFEDGPLDKEYDRIKKAVSDTETREINNSKKPIKKSTKKKTEAVDKSSEDRLQEIANEIKEIPIIKKHTLDHTWLSGSSTKVYPVSTYLDTNGTGHIDIQLDTKRNYFDKAIQQIKDKYPEITDGWFNKTDDSCPANLEFKYDSKSDKNVKTEAVNIEDVNIEKEKEKVNDDLQRAGAKDMIDTENELVDGIKKEIYQYTKQQGLDLEKLRKQGVELETISDTIDKVVGDMVSKSAIEFMDQTGQEINWDFEIKDNDIHIVWGNQ